MKRKQLSFIIGSGLLLTLAGAAPTADQTALTVLTPDATGTLRSDSQNVSNSSLADIARGYDVGSAYQVTTNGKSTLYEKSGVDGALHKGSDSKNCYKTNVIEDPQVATDKKPPEPPVSPSPLPSTNKDPANKDPAPANVVGPTQSNSANLPLLNDTQEGNLAFSSFAVQEAPGRELVELSNQRRAAIQDAANSDGATLSRYYQDLPISSLGSYFSRAKETLDQTVDTLSKAAQVDDSGEAARFRNIYMNARDKADAGNQLLEEEKKTGEPNPFTVFSPLTNPAAALAKTASLNDLFGAFDPITKTPKLPSAQDNLTNRVLMLAGLPNEKRAEVLKKLQLAEPLNLSLPGQNPKTLLVLHNGYIWGGGKTGVDCSSFISSLLPGNENNSRYTTFDFAAMWHYLYHGRIPNPPFQFRKNRELEIRKAAAAFTPVNIYQNEPLMVGDILVFRMPLTPVGHVFLVRGYNSTTKVARVIEAAQTKGTINERDFSLLYRMPASNQSILFPGLWGLRLKQTDNSVCRFRDRPTKKGGRKS